MDADVLAKCNPCLSSPCLNRGVCHSDPAEVYRCSCPPGFKVRYTGRRPTRVEMSQTQMANRDLTLPSQGKNCETALNACVSNPCANGGTCQLAEQDDGEYR